MHHCPHTPYRNPNNRRVLGKNFASDPAHPVAKGMADKLNDAITLHDVNEHVMEQVGLQQRGWGRVSCRP